MAETSTRRTLTLLLCYLPIGGFLALALEKRDREVRWHARNGLLLLASVAAVGLVATAAGLLLPSLSCLYPLLMLGALVGYVLITTLAVVKAVGGERLIVPGVSRFAG